MAQTPPGMVSPSPSVAQKSAWIIEGTGSDDLIYNVTRDSFDNLYIVGKYSGNPTIKDQSGVPLVTLPNSTGSSSFMCKFDSSGRYQYYRLISSNSTCVGTGIVCDSAGNVYLCGRYHGTSVTIKDPSGTTLGTLLNSTGSTIFMCKFGFEIGQDKFSFGANIMLPINQNLTGGNVVANHRWSVNLNYSL